MISIPTLAACFVFLPVSDPMAPRSFDLAGVPRVVSDVAPDGVVSALGRHWKMIFDRDGAAFFPILGRSAPRSPVLRFALPGIAVPKLDGERVTIERDGFLEVYDLSVESVEQSFVFAKRPGDGDLILRLPLATELAPLPRAQSALRFDADGLAEIHYSDATVIDRDGRRLGVESVLVDGAIEITVPDAFLDTAGFPLIVDPIIQSFPIDGTLTVASDPDIVFAKQTDEWFVAYERAISSTDRDVILRRFSAAGTFVADFAIATNTDDATDPAIAERSGVILTVWDHQQQFEAIKARRVVASTSQMGSTFDVAFGGPSNGANFPDVGSTDESVSAPYCVIWNTGVGDVRYQMVSDSGIVGPFNNLIGPVPTSQRPSILPFAPSGTQWVAVAPRVSSGMVNPVVSVVKTDGKLGGSMTLDGSVFFDATRTVIAGTSVNAMVAYVRSGTPGNDLVARAIHVQPVAPHSISQGFDVLIGSIDHGGSESVDQTEVALGYDGARFLVAYAEEKSPGQPTDVVASVWGKSGLTLTQLQPLVSLSIGSIPEFEIGVGAAGLDRPGEVLVAWTEDVSGVLTNDNVDGALFSTLSSSSVTTTVQTGCGSPEPLLAVSSTVIAGGPFNASIIGAASPLLVAGFPTNLPLCPAQAGCALGATPLVLTAIPPSISIAWPTDSGLIGVPIALQVIDLLPPNATGVMCGPPKYPQKFRVSDTKVVTAQ